MVDTTLSAPRRIPSLMTIIAVLALVGAASWLGWRLWQMPAAKAPATSVSSQAIEAKWGIRFTLLGVTADGGLIDLRYQVIDASKAQALGQDLATLPVLIDEQSGLEITTTVSSHKKHTMVQGQTHFMLYMNRNGVIQAGHPVTIRIGDVQIEHLIAQ